MSNSGTLELITNMSSGATEVLKSAAYGAINGTAAGINVGISSGLIDATKSLGSLAGTSILPGAGSIMGSAVGFTIGSALSSGTGALVGALFAAKNSISTELTKNHKMMNLNVTHSFVIMKLNVIEKKNGYRRDKKSVILRVK